MAQSITPLHSRPDPELKEFYTLISRIILTSFHVFRVQICQSQSAASLARNHAVEFLTLHYCCHGYMQWALLQWSSASWTEQ